MWVGGNPAQMKMKMKISDGAQMKIKISGNPAQMKTKMKIGRNPAVGSTETKNQAPVELRDKGDEGGTRRLEREKKLGGKKKKQGKPERERKRKKRENICLMREEREVNNIFFF